MKLIAEQSDVIAYPTNTSRPPRPPTREMIELSRDPANRGPAKTIGFAVHELGIDITDQVALDGFIAEVNRERPRLRSAPSRPGSVKAVTAWPGLDALSSLASIIGGLTSAGTHRSKVGPNCWLEVAVEDGRVKVEAVGPHHRPAFWIDRDLREKVRIIKRGKDGTLVPTDEELELTYKPVVERDPHDVGLWHLYGLDMGDTVLSLHGSGSIVPGG